MIKNYNDIKELKKQLDDISRVGELLALHRSNDPFYTGTKGQKEKAEWFQEIWQRFGYDEGVHLRRIHYQLISQDDPRLYNGEPYENTEKCWNKLLQGAKFARHLGYISADRLVDRRNPEPIISVKAENILEPNVDVDNYKPDEWNKPEIQASLKDQINWEIPEPQIIDYYYTAAEQPYYLELWIEKSTMNDVLEPVCQEYGINLVTGEGFQSITSTVEALKRMQKLDKPARVFYISDFDPAGKGMPVAVARQIEFYRKRYAENVEVKLEPIALNLDQVKQYELPRTPIKDTDRRKENFEQEYGEGAVELDALEALYPGRLQEIVEEHAKKYRDPKLKRKFRRAKNKYKKQAKEKWEQEIAREIEELEGVQHDTTEILERYRAKLDELNSDLQEELQPLMGRLENIQQSIKEKARNFEFNKLDKPEGDAEVGAENGYLFDSNRGYLEQLRSYKNTG